MIWPFKKSVNSFLGIDIGTFTIRVVELARTGDQKNLENYGYLSVTTSLINPEKTRRGALVLSPGELAEIIGTILRESQIKSNRAFFSLPDFATFFTSFTLPPMTREEVADAVRFEARRHVPMPLSEVTLDWLIVGGDPSVKKEEREILLVVVPNETVNQYAKIAELSQLQLIGLEAEVFGLQRALVGNRSDLAAKTVCLIDIGAQSTTCSIVDKNILKYSYSFDSAGNVLTERIAKSLNLNYETAERLKQNQGLLPGGPNVRDVLAPVLDIIIETVKKVTEDFYRQEGKETEAYLVSGNPVLTPGFTEYFSKGLGKEIEIGDPFTGINYPLSLKPVLKELAPSFAIAVGMALKGLE